MDEVTETAVADTEVDTEVETEVDTEAMRELTSRLNAATFLKGSVAAVQCLQLTAIREAVLLARRNPELYVAPSPKQTRVQMIRYAERCVVFDLALRQSSSENTVWAQFHDADTLMTRLPKLWLEFRAGKVAYPNMRTAAEVARSLPEDSRVFALLDAALLTKAALLTPSKFRTATRALRERLHPEDPVQRHQAAREGRYVQVEPADDGMGWLHLYTDAATVTKIRARLNAAATRQRMVPYETRTLAQLRADSAGDLLIGRGTAGEVTAHVQICVPASTLLEQPELLSRAQSSPSILDGYGPIDQATALLLAADAPSFRRIFTDPISGVDLNMDRRTYRPTAAQREWLRRKYCTCIAPTCSRPAAESDLDHWTDWKFDGLTNDDNLAPISREHHTLKHKTKIQLKRHPSGRYTWATPTGFTRDNDPPPF